MIAGGLVKYDAMCRAIAEAHGVDEVKDIRDKASAIEAYARQARNTEAETKACEIRLRAERRAGQMLATMDKAEGAQGNPNGQGAAVVRSHAASTQTKPLAELGISHTQSSRWQRLAAIPEDDFEATFAAPGRKSTAGLIAQHVAKPAPAPEPVAGPACSANWITAVTLRGVIFRRGASASCALAG